jgi:hypothetical protein
MQAMLQDSRVQMARHMMLQRAMKELDPVTFFSDEHKVLQNQKIENIERLITNISKRRRGRLTQSDLLEIDHQILSFKKWQAGAQQGIKRFAQDMALFEKKPGFYKVEDFLAAKYELYKNGNYPEEGGLVIAPGDFIGGVSKLEPFDTDGFTTEKVDKVYRGGEWIDAKIITTEYGLPMVDDPTRIDPVETKKMRDRMSMGYYMSDPQNMAWGRDGWRFLKEDALRGNLKAQTEVAKYEQLAADYKSKAAAQNYLDRINDKDRDYPPEISPANLWARDQGAKVIQSPTVKREEDFETIGRTQQRLDAAEKKEPEVAGKLEFVGGGSENKTYGLTSGFTKQGKSLGAEKVTFYPEETWAIPMDKVEKGKRILLDGDFFLISAPVGGKIYDVDQGKFLYDIDALLNHDLELKDGRLDYSLPVYSGEKIEVKFDKKYYSFYPGQPVGEEQLPLLKQWAEDNQRALSEILEEGGHDFARLVFKIGAVGGVPGDITVYRNLSDGYIAKELFTGI